MTQLNSNAAVAFGSWIAVLGGIWFLFDKSENVASVDTKRRVTRWLKNLGAPEGISWPETFALVFDSVFTERHLSWKCLRRSVLATGCGLVLAALIGSTVWPTEAAEFREHLLLTGVTRWFRVGSVACIANLLGTYISILKTRCVIHLMIRRRSASWIGGLLLLDAVTTLVIMWTGFVLVLAITGALTDPISEFNVTFSLPPTLSLVLLAGPASVSPFPFGVLFYAPLLTPVWAWLYVVSGSTVKLVHQLSVSVVTLLGLLDIDSKPIASLGWVAMLLTSIVFWALALVRWLRT